MNLEAPQRQLEAATKGGSLGESIEQFLTRINEKYRMSDTPRTDAAMQSDQCCPNCEDFARMLERELAIVHDLIKGGADWSNRYVIAADERDQWQRQAFEMQDERDAARKALAAAQPSGEYCSVDKDYWFAVQSERDTARKALQEIIDMQPVVDFAMPADWHEQIAACPECQGWAKNHPIQRGICDLHRKPLYARERHEKDAQTEMPGRMREIARKALAK